MPPPLITIGITCFNAEKTITRAIKSAITQDWKNFEIIIVDDNSTDFSKKMILKEIQNYSNIRLIEHRKNKGPAGSRNTIIDHAKGEFIVFFDDDDLSFPNRITIQYQKIINYEIQHPYHITMCYASGSRIYPNNYQIDLPAIGSKNKDTIPHGISMANRLLFYGGNPMLFYGAGTPTCALMTRTNTLKKSGGFDENFYRVEDVDLAINIALNGGYFIGCSEKLFLQYATNAQDKSPLRNLHAEQQLAEKYKDHLKKNRRYHYAKLWPKLRYHYFMRQYLRLCLTFLHVLFYHPIAVPVQICNTGIKRIIHDYKINRKKALNPHV